ncbi:hypothetical protein [Thiofilum flexile]|uniref:hypothetical protein n=1 Tax=Thiofilum flexile TaxID=125627 RepID=UPI000382EC5A|nr:hypothetical protein [Thiofilum flexile]
MKGLCQSCTWIIVLWLLGGSIQAIEAGNGGTVSLRAITPSGAPLMRPVAWKIYEVKNNRRWLTKGFDRHAGVLELPPGNYVAEISFNGIQYEQPFTLKPHHDVDVTISIRSEVRVF